MLIQSLTYPLKVIGFFRAQSRKIQKNVGLSLSHIVKTPWKNSAWCCVLLHPLNNFHRAIHTSVMAFSLLMKVSSLLLLMGKFFLVHHQAKPLPNFNCTVFKKRGGDPPLLFLWPFSKTTPLTKLKYWIKVH